MAPQNTGTAPRYAAIDCGTNSIRLLISEVREDGTLRELNRDNIIVRLGQGVDATGRFADEALGRVEDALEIYADRMVEYGVRDVMMGATSATRDASNREEFFEITRRLLGRVREGAVAEVISGEQEARLSFRGAVMDLPQTSADSLDTTCVIDLGGGSTEFVVGGTQAYSADMGCVRLTERHLQTVPPKESEISDAQATVAKLLAEVEQYVDLTSVTRVVGVAGTMTTLCALAQELESYEPEKIHMHTLPLARLREVAMNLVPLTPQQRMEFGPMHPGRADVIGGGALVVEAFTRRFEELGLTDITISEKDILDGILAEVIDRAR
ncbi:Ppx/GppA family phosphatase [Corynebacterium sp. 320]|uniref:Ppx/GppA phosphatase family protein n=1 Tax=Corynebacterium TaxID=1716 RepID=UPI00125CB37E|nr:MULTISPECIES: Ppx/GppA phosphatase family protein [Corynebacterium]KAB1504042.1 Ppx/GppA family phosphatase [Corynebacterium sp. 320]KAB1552859.1 Ppx/GppA family phosphatase [Corynebacterium sp. 321]KAB1553923.1 Ppx/GppA family phosphatase [Corynebacterium sp. 319]KAB3528178.1 Ppx/GppA family phosphatase [Corynebacterium sp. 250]KAB3540334.1 Ppx/GppA family phosphatase [Corynebacterium sp. 366]